MNVARVKIGSFGSLGFCLRTSSVPFSVPIAIAGSESVTKLINSNWIAANGTTNLLSKNANKVVAITTKIAPVLPVNKYLIAFLIFVKIFLPTVTAFTIVAKLSSVRIISAASLETSEPVIPIAIPISACFNAGASFTPSPLIPTTFPFACHALTIRILCSGATRAYTDIFSKSRANSSSVIFSNVKPSTTISPSWKIPILRAIERAVTAWSPVIIIGLIPALIAFSTASFDSSRGGSIIEVNPTNVKLFSSSNVNSSLASFLNA